MLEIVKGDIMERIIFLQESQEFERVSIDPSAFNDRKKGVANIIYKFTSLVRNT